MYKHALFFICCAAIAVYLVASTFQWERTVRSYEARFTPIAATEQRPNSGRIFLDNDAYCWVGYAQKMAETGSGRIRQTEADNVPYGRPVHWSQLVSWFLLLAGWLRHLFVGDSFHLAIENAAIWINPFQQLLLLIGGGWLLFRRLGLVPAMLWICAFATIPSIQWTYHPLRPDHHGFHFIFNIFSLLTLLLGGLGWVRPTPAGATEPPEFFGRFQLPKKQMAKRYFIAAGILGGFGFWTGATVQFLGIAIFTTSAFLLIHFMPPKSSDAPNKDSAYEPSLWRLWALSGAITSATFYLIEYAPNFPGMRLEINHPLYAFSWLCAGELLTRLAAAKTQTKPKTGPPMLALLSLGALLLPALLFWGPAKWHSLHDPFMQRLHQFIDEFQPFLKLCQAHPWSTIFNEVGVFPLFLILAPFLTDEKRSTLYEWAALWMTFLPALMFGALTLWQARWIIFFAGFSLLLALVVLAVLLRQQREAHRSIVWPCVLIAAVLAQSFYFASFQFRDIRFRDISHEGIGELISPILQRQFAERLSTNNTNGAIRLMSAPHLAPRLYHYGRLPGVASYYWENIKGLHDAAIFFAAQQDEEALQIVRERGITHVVIPPSADFATMFYYIKNGYASEQDVRASMVGRMLAQPEALPRWIKRNPQMERALQPGYLFDGKPIKGSLLVFSIQPAELQ